MPDFDIACELDVFTVDESARHRELLETLRLGVASAERRPGAVRFALGDRSLLPPAAEFVTYESRCCSFFGFALELQPGGEASLTVSGPEEGLELIANALL